MAERKHPTRFIGTGIHGGVIYMRGEVGHVGKEVKVDKTNDEDLEIIHRLVEEFYIRFKYDLKEIIGLRY